MSDHRIVSPTERNKKLAAHREKADKERRDLEEAINEVASTPAGLTFLRHLAAATGHGKNPVVFKMEAGMVMPMEGATLYNGARYSVYADEVRDYLTPRNRMKVEQNT